MTTATTATTLDPTARVLLAALRRLAAQQAGSRGERGDQFTTSHRRMVELAERAGLVQPEAEAAWTALTGSHVVLIDDRGPGPDVNDTRRYRFTAAVPTPTRKPEAKRTPMPKRQPIPHRLRPTTSTPSPATTDTTSTTTTTTATTPTEPRGLICGDCRTAPITWREARSNGRCESCRARAGRKPKSKQQPWNKRGQHSIDADGLR